MPSGRVVWIELPFRRMRIESECERPFHTRLSWSWFEFEVLPTVTAARVASLRVHFDCESRSKWPSIAVSVSSRSTVSLLDVPLLQSSFASLPSAGAPTNSTGKGFPPSSRHHTWWSTAGEGSRPRILFRPQTFSISRRFPPTSCFVGLLHPTTMFRVRVSIRSRPSTAGRLRVVHVPCHDRKGAT